MLYVEAYIDTGCVFQYIENDVQIKIMFDTSHFYSILIRLSIDKIFLYTINGERIKDIINL